MPTIPDIVENNNNTYRMTRIAKLISLIGIENVAMATAETIIIMILDVRAASVAAVPKISPPTVVAVPLTAFGKRILASVSSSKK